MKRKTSSLAPWSRQRGQIPALIHNSFSSFKFRLQKKWPKLPTDTTVCVFIPNKTRSILLLCFLAQTVKHGMKKHAKIQKSTVRNNVAGNRLSQQAKTETRTHTKVWLPCCPQIAAATSFYCRPLLSKILSFTLAPNLNCTDN